MDEQYDDSVEVVVSDTVNTGKGRKLSGSVSLLAAGILLSISALTLVFAISMSMGLG